MQCLQSLVSTVFDHRGYFAKTSLKGWVQWVEQPSVRSIFNTFSMEMSSKCRLGLPDDGLSDICHFSLYFYAELHEEMGFKCDLNPKAFHQTFFLVQYNLPILLEPR